MLQLCSPKFGFQQVIELFPRICCHRTTKNSFHKRTTPENESNIDFTFEENRKNKLYEEHLPINYFQKANLIVGSAITSLLDPKRHDMIAVLGETTGYYALNHIYSKMNKDSEGINILEERPRINSTTINLEELSNLPQNTLGYKYIQFLSDNKVTPDSRLSVRFIDNARLAYVMQRYREVHDLFHTVLGMPTNMLGEVAVKWIEALQTGLPMCLGGAMFGPIRLRPKQRVTYINTLLPWALRVGQQAKPLMNIYFEKRWDQNLNELRRELNIENPPVI